MHDTVLKGKSIEELKTVFQNMEEPSYRAKQAFLRINKHLAGTLDEFTEFPKSLRKKLEENHSYPSLQIIHSSPEADGTEKVIFSAGKDHRGKEILIETVWLVSEKRRTLCISSQIGCSLNCSFCATGTIPFGGNLDAWVILDQVYEMIRHKNETITNIVFMGMGEPFYNYENVIKAARILNDDSGLNLSARHITISTAGVLPSIHRFTQERQPFNLALSLNQPFSEKRGEMMDIEKRHPLWDVISALKEYTETSGKRITFEYVCIPEMNMSEQDALEIIKIAKKLPSKVNLIPLNTNLQGWKRPSSDEMLAFQKILTDAGIRAFNRGSAGRNVNGACGMLALNRKNRQ